MFLKIWKIKTQFLFMDVLASIVIYFVFIIIILFSAKTPPKIT